MDKIFLIQLTNEIYRLTLLFPKKEPLRYKMREVADDILAKWLCRSVPNPNSVENCSRPNLELEILDSFFEVAKNQNWVSSAEILKLQEEYSKVSKDLKEHYEERIRSEEKEKAAVVGVRPQQPPQQPDYETRAHNVKRQQKILGILKEKGKAQVWEIKKNFPEVTKRTVRRDFRHLLKQGSIERLGERNETFYQLKVKELGQVVQ